MMKEKHNLSLYLSEPWVTVTRNPVGMHGFQPVHNTRIVAVNRPVDGATRTYLAYDSRPSGREIRLYYTDDLDRPWTPYSGNPILDSSPAATFRCPVVAYDDGIFHMFLWSVRDKEVQRWTSTDGINYTYQEVIPVAEAISCNMAILDNTNDNYWYLYTTECISGEKHVYVRKASSITGLASATRYSTGIVGYTFWSVIYHEGQYWFVAESNPTSSNWQVDAFTSLSPDLDIEECSNSPILANDEACPRLGVSPDGTRLYIFVSRRDAGQWHGETRGISFRDCELRE